MRTDSSPNRLYDGADALARVGKRIGQEAELRRPILGPDEHRDLMIARALVMGIADTLNTAGARLERRIATN